MLSPEEFFAYYEKNLRQYELGGWHLVRKPLRGDTGTFYMAMYQKAMASDLVFGEDDIYKYVGEQERVE